jgi:hypothetical protein
MITQLADMERFHAQVVQRLQAELNEAREHSQMLKGPSTERLGAKGERQINSGNKIDIQREASEETGAKATATNNSGVVRGNPIILSHGPMEAAVPVYISLDNSVKVSEWIWINVYFLIFEAVLNNNLRGKSTFGVQEKMFSVAHVGAVMRLLYLAFFKLQ